MKFSLWMVIYTSNWLLICCKDNPESACSSPIKCLDHKVFTFCFIFDGLPVLQNGTFTCPSGYKCVEDVLEPCHEEITANNIVNHEGSTTTSTPTSSLATRTRSTIRTGSATRTRSISRTSSASRTRSTIRTGLATKTRTASRTRPATRTSPATRVSSASTSATTPTLITTLVLSIRAADFSTRTTNTLVSSTTAVSTATTGPGYSSLMSVNLPTSCRRAANFTASNCNQYYECDFVLWWWDLKLQTCPIGQNFDAFRKICVPNEEANCAEHVESKSTSPVVRLSINEDNTRATATPPSTCKDTTKKLPAAKCNQYYACVHVLWFLEVQLETCPFGEAFDTIQNQCITAEQANCVL